MPCSESHPGKNGALSVNIESCAAAHQMLTQACRDVSETSTGFHDAGRGASRRGEVLRGETKAGGVAEVMYGNRTRMWLFIGVPTTSHKRYSYVCRHQCVMS